MPEDATIIDGENYRNTNTGGFREVIMNQVKKIINTYSQELTKGFMKYSQPNQFGIQEPIAYVSDGRKSYSQSVEALYDLLQPKFDTKAKANIDLIKDKLKEKYKDYIKCNGIDWDIEKVKIMREMFQELCLFLERLGWLEESGFEQ
jgi:hypothetical protein